MGEYSFGGVNKIGFSQYTESWMYKINGQIAVESGFLVLTFKVIYLYFKNMESNSYEIRLSREQISRVSVYEKWNKTIIELFVENPGWIIAWPDSNKKRIKIELTGKQKLGASNLLLDFINETSREWDNNLTRVDSVNTEYYFFKMYDEMFNVISGFLNVSDGFLEISYHSQGGALESYKYKANSFRINNDDITYLKIQKKLFQYLLLIDFKGLEKIDFPNMKNNVLALKLSKKYGYVIEQKIMELVNKKYDKIIDQK